MGAITIPEITVVIGIDRKTFQQFVLSFPTWLKNKPSLFQRRFVIFHDGVDVDGIKAIFPCLAPVTYVQWPPSGVRYLRDGLTKWDNPQRAKMLAGFVHVPAMYVSTPYWLKVDMDVVAHGQDDWIDPAWFADEPAIIAPGWGYSKPPDIVDRLDDWAQVNVEERSMQILYVSRPLQIPRDPASDLVSHSRICSWCAFFNTGFTRQCAAMAEDTCGEGQIPVDSQDTFHWYVAERSGSLIRNFRPRQCGWQVCGTFRKLQEVAGACQNV